MNRDDFSLNRTPPRIDPLDPPERLLFGPGPTPVDPRILRAMSAPVLGHLDPAFGALMSEVSDMLRYVFGTANAVTLALSGTGTSGMEAALVNAIEPGDPVVIGVNGYFGSRMVEMAQRFGGQVRVVEAAWGNILPVEILVEAALETSARVVALVHAETSTGVLQPLEGLADQLRALPSDPLLVVDTVTSLGAHPVEVDANGIDLCYSGSQKALSAPSGIAPFTVSERAMERLRSRKIPVGSWYFDAQLLHSYWRQEGPRAYHHTASSPMVYALHEALRIVCEEGLANRWQRHERHRLALQAGVEAMGLDMHAAEGHRLRTLHTVRVPEGVDASAVQKALLNEFDIEIGGGIGSLSGKIWRIGLMGYGSSRRNLLLELGALGSLLARDSHIGDAGAGVAAASAHLKESQPVAV